MNKGKVQNPLTIIAIFAGIAEVAGTGVLIGLPIEIQQVFVWFVMSFPFVLIAAFFLILTFKHQVLYAPSDFSSDQHFIDLLNHKLQNDLVEVSEIVSEAQAVIKEPNGSDSTEKQKVVEDKLDELQTKLESHFTTYFDPNSIQNILQVWEKTIIHALRQNPEGMNIGELSHATGMSGMTLTDALKRLTDKEKIYITVDGKFHIKK